MITPDQFFGKYDGKGIDFDNYYGFQCMDLYRQFVKECLEFPQSPPVTGAKDVWDTYLQDKFERIGNTLTNCPIKGDIVIWGTDIGKFGHIAICKDGTPNSFTSFDQNWPSQGYTDTDGNFHGTGVCHFQSHNYNGVLGWLRVKPPTPQPEPPVILPPPPVCPPDLSGEVTDLKGQIAQLKSEIEYADEEIRKIQGIVWGKGWPFQKVNALKVLVPK